MTDRLTGVVTPLLTPFGDDLSFATEMYVAHARRVLDQGADYLSPFGTTGEATSVSPDERRAALEALAAAGIAPDRLMPGTGLCSLAETADLTRHAATLGCAAAMVLPPFFYSAPTEDGLYRAYATLIDTLGAQCPRIILYNIPQNTGVPITPALTARLNTAFPEVVVAYKDSSGDFDNTGAVIASAPGVSVFPASEVFIPRAVALGAGGCISATCNSNVTAIKALFDAARAGEETDALMPAITAHREAAQKAGLIGGLKALMARRTGEARWLNLRPPHVNADPALAGMFPEAG